MGSLGYTEYFGIWMLVALLGQCSQVKLVPCWVTLGNRIDSFLLFPFSKSFENSTFDLSLLTFFSPKGSRSTEVGWRGSILISILVKDNLRKIGMRCLIISHVISSSKIPVPI